MHQTASNMPEKNRVTLLFKPSNSHIVGSLLPLLGDLDHIEWVAKSISSLQAVSHACRESKLLVVDKSCLPDGCLQELANLIAQAPHTKLVLSVSKPLTLEEMSGLVRLGIRGCLPIESAPELYVRAINAVLRDELWYPHLVLALVIQDMVQMKAPKAAGPQKVFNNVEADNLTIRERSVIEQVQRGFSNKEIANNLGISDETVKRHISNLFQKLGVRRRTQLFHALKP